jgi:UDP-N-acetylglucosamine acyltransferase|tara:strand:- start:6550 stop:7374 length:825 start_codon:yes stop_codon:yes gene_type:complete
MSAAAMASQIHPTALVDPAAQLGEGVSIGPYAVVGPEVQIGSGTRIGPHAVLDGRVRLGRDNHIFAGACIGQEPQDLKYTGDPTEVVIGDGNRIREYVTINRATAGDEQTVLGDGNLLMAYSHIGHNCRLGNRIVIANGVAVAGHVNIDDRAVIGGVLGIHQFVHIGSLAMVGGMSRIDRDVPPFMMVEGHPGRLRGLNRIGLKRSGLAEQDNGAALKDLQQLWKLLYRSGLPFTEALQQAASTAGSEPGHKLIAFLEASCSANRRGPLPAQRS